MRKIILIGSGGSGKSTLARSLGEKLGYPVDHLDVLLWRSNWEAVSREEQLQIQHTLTSRDTWIIDGNYGGTLDLRVNAADTIIFLDLPRTLCLYRALRRTWRYRKIGRPDMAVDCPEKLSFDFLKWIWRFPIDKRPSILSKLTALSDKQIIHLTSRRAVKQFLQSLPET
ncbi:DNA topology modulation protein [uncultured Exiguobacterium sp.]|uniref:DNA topology modulation protein n=1 Tax=uncultured Exiguobacterium sp. TaxID=202669 RepID=UPI0025DE56FB|nr:DNA topology modulation protein [uncultured Exiguobacterium sp.]